MYNTRRDGLNKATTGLTQGISLVNRELAMTQPLVKQGAASSVEVLRLQRQANELENKLSDVRTQYYVQAREELAKANAEVETQRSVIRGREDSSPGSTLLRQFVALFRILTSPRLAASSPRW